MRMQRITNRRGGTVVRRDSCESFRCARKILETILRTANRPLMWTVIFFADLLVCLERRTMKQKFLKRPKPNDRSRKVLPQSQATSPIRQSEPFIRRRSLFLHFGDGACAYLTKNRKTKEYAHVVAARIGGGGSSTCTPQEVASYLRRRCGDYALAFARRLHWHDVARMIQDAERARENKKHLAL